MLGQPASIGREGPRRVAVLAAGLAAALSAACLSGPAAGGPRHAVAVRHAPREAPYDVEHYAIEIALDPARESIEATCKVRLWPTRGALERVELDLVGLTVSAVRDERGRALEWRQSGGA